MTASRRRPEDADLAELRVLFPIRFRMTRAGGVSSYNTGLFAAFGDRDRVTVFDMTGREGEWRRYGEGSRALLYPLRRRIGVALDIWRLAAQARRLDIDVVHLNPSLNRSARNSLRRDLAFAKAAVRAGVPFVVFIHGWADDYADHLEKRGQARGIAAILGKAQRVFVLAAGFRDRLIRWGIRRERVTVETTFVPDAFFQSFDLERRLSEGHERGELRVLFLSRLVAPKGIFVAIDAMQRLLDRGVPARLTVAGDGPDKTRAERYAGRVGLRNVEFVGLVTGRAKEAVYRRSDVLLLPTAHAEGLPITVLEAMAAGLAVVTRPVGGLKDMFQEGKMGYATESLEPSVFADLLARLAADRRRMDEIARFNRTQAGQRFLASQVAGRMEAYYREAATTGANGTGGRLSS